MIWENRNRNVNVLFAEFDDDKINAEGWGGEEGKLDLRLTNPIHEEKSIDALDEAIEKEKFENIGSLELDTPEQAFGKLQNAFESHPLDNRSMSIGDVVVCGKKGKIVERGFGFSDLSNEQVTKLSKLKIKIK